MADHKVTVKRMGGHTNGAGWYPVTQVPQVTVVDCTIRDGGLMNKSNFTLDFVQAVYRALGQAGVQVMELGYRDSRKKFDSAQFGPWRFCDDEMIKRVVGDQNYPGTRIAVMMDAHKCDEADLKPRELSLVGLVLLC